MKTEILLAVEFDGEAVSVSQLPPPTRGIIVHDINEALRLWAAQNPYGLRNPEHLRLTMGMFLAKGPEPQWPLDKLAHDLTNIGKDMLTMAALCRSLDHANHS